MSIRQLRTLRAIQTHGSFSSAATACHITHAAVSQQMKALESMWGVALFDRSQRRPQLTSTGKAMAAKADEILRAYDGMLATVLGDGAFQGDFVLGAVPTTLTGLVPLAVSLLRQRHAKLHVVIDPGMSHQLMQQLDRGAIDAAIISRPNLLPQGLACLDIAAEPMQLLAPPQTKSDKPFDLLRTHPFIRFDRNAIFGQMVESWLQQHNINVKESMELEGLEAISSMVMANLGVSIVPKRCVRNMNPLPLKRLALGPNTPARQLSLAYRDDNPKLAVIKAGEKALLDAVRIGEFSPK